MRRSKRLNNKCVNRAGNNYVEGSSFGRVSVSQIAKPGRHQAISENIISELDSNTSELESDVIHSAGTSSLNIDTDLNNSFELDSNNTSELESDVIHSAGISSLNIDTNLNNSFELDSNNTSELESDIIHSAGTGSLNIGNNINNSSLIRNQTSKDLSSNLIIIY